MLGPCTLDVDTIDSQQLQNYMEAAHLSFGDIEKDESDLVHTG